MAAALEAVGASARLLPFVPRPHVAMAGVKVTLVRLRGIAIDLHPMSLARASPTRDGTTITRAMGPRLHHHHGGEPAIARTLVQA